MSNLLANSLPAVGPAQSPNLRPETGAGTVATRPAQLFRLLPAHALAADSLRLVMRPTPGLASPAGNRAPIRRYKTPRINIMEAAKAQCVRTQSQRLSDFSRK
jgi:hypothetical protein